MGDTLKFNWEVTFFHATNGMKHAEITAAFAEATAKLAFEFATKHKLVAVQGHITSQRGGKIERSGQ